jgi:hypothetical protein
MDLQLRQPLQQVAGRSALALQVVYTTTPSYYFSDLLRVQCKIRYDGMMKTQKKNYSQLFLKLDANSTQL